MGKLTCPCLNINIHIKGVDPQKLDPALLGLSFDQLTAPFFEQDIAEVKLDLGGVAEEQGYLIHKSKVSDWSIRTCVNCSTPSYATHSSKGRVLVNLNLLRDEKTQERVQAAADFSPLFRVSLKDSGEKSGSSSLVHPVTGNQEGIRKTVTQLQEQLNKYISREKLAMEERIRRYSEEQKAAFSELQKRAYQDKNIMVGVILNAEERNLEDSLSDAMMDSTLSSLTPPTTPITRPGIMQSRNDDMVASSLPTSRAPFGNFNASIPRSRPIPQIAHRHMPSSMARSMPAHAQHSHINRSSDADPIFDLEGFTQDDEPFFESDESSTDDNSLNEENMAAPLSKEHAEFATSLPISMPLWKKPEMHDFEEGDSMDEKVPMPEPERMMASMRAMSHSVQDGTEMFGDLPRPRLNTVGETTIVKKSGRRK